MDNKNNCKLRDLKLTRNFLQNPEGTSHIYSVIKNIIVAAYFALFHYLFPS